MMTLRCLGSGSSGNCYLIENETECLILDCGIPTRKIKKSLDFNVSKIVGVVVTHSHKDHSLSVNEFEKMGIPVFKPYEPNRRNFIKLGNFVIHSFKVPHDDTECYGFLINHKETGKILYLTDLEYCPYTFSSHKVQHIICEANYDMQFVDKERPNYEHILRGHMSLQECCKIAEVNRTEHLQNFIICHLSELNSHSDYFKAEVEKVAKCPVFVAEKGLEVELRNKDLCPFM